MAADGGEPEILVAGPFRLDVREQRLLRDNLPVDITGKPFAILAALMREAERLVSKDQLFEQVWQGRAVSEAVLTSAMRQLRSALGDDARNPTIIETVHGYGYRFLLPAGPPVEEPPPSVMAAFETVAAPVAPRRGSRSTRALAISIVALALAAVALIAARNDFTRAPSLNPKSIVIAPFVDLSPAQGQEWFADGMTEEVLMSLSRAPDLQVASRAAGETILGATDPNAMARESVGAAHLLQGGVRRADGRVRVTAQLSRTTDGFTLWTEVFDRPEADVISIQEEIAVEIARALKSVMDPETFRAMSEAGTRSVDAYEAYLRGIALGRLALDGGNLDFARQSREAYERARKIDPQFAAAHWKSAETWFGQVTRTDARSAPEGLSFEALLAGYFERVDAAIATSKSETEALRYKAAREVFSMNPKKALNQITRYAEQRPGSIDAFDEMSRIAAYSADLPAMSRAADRMHAIAIERDLPLSRAITTTLMARRPRVAVKRARQHLALQPDGALINYQAQRAFIWTSNFEEARRALEKVEASDLPGEIKRLAAMRQACAEGRRAAAAADAEIVYENGSIGAQWQAAEIMGDKDRAHALLVPLDTIEGAPTLMQFMFQPTFDASAYPNLSRRLREAGVRPLAPMSMPYSCNIA